MTNYVQGIYEVKNKEKYVGKSNPRFLSSWELEVFKEFDSNKNILEWGAETIIVPYYNPIKRRMARYMVDLYCKYQDKDGKIIRELVEIKPMAEVAKPVIGGKRKKSTDVYATATYIINMAKWTAAAKYAHERGMNFRIITEQNIY